MQIPFNRARRFTPNFYSMLGQIAHQSGDGPYTKMASQRLATIFKGAPNLLTTSCTHALEMCALLLNVQPGDEVIVPSFTFVSTANAFVLRGAKPVFIDSRADTLNLDESQLEELVTERTKAIVPVHYAGVGCEMDRILDVASERAIHVVEDNAHGLFGKYRGQPLGTFGDFSTLSFHETKNITCGEGGAIVINTNEFVSRAEIIREKGTNRSRFFRGEVDKYSWVDVGSSYLPSDILAALLLSQLEQSSEIQDRRKVVWEYYDQHLANWRQANDTRGPIVPTHCDQAYHMYYLLLPDLATRGRFISHLKDKGIMAVFHYLPLNTSQMGQHFGGRQGQCPVAEDLSDRIVRLPFFPDLTDAELAYIVDAVTRFET